jgi:SAM-dependent methyltransferase
LRILSSLAARGQAWSIHALRRAVQGHGGYVETPTGIKGLIYAGAVEWLRTQDITATNISDVALRFLATTGKLPPCRTRSLNAEDIDLPNESMDFVLCRQAFHHFPRPMIGFYEMWRVARLGVVLIEPADILPVRIFERVRTLAKSVLRGQRGDETLFEADAATLS